MCNCNNTKKKNVNINENDNEYEYFAEVSSSTQFPKFQTNLIENNYSKWETINNQIGAAAPAPPAPPAPPAAAASAPPLASPPLPPPPPTSSNINTSVLLNPSIFNIVITIIAAYLYYSVYMEGHSTPLGNIVSLLAILCCPCCYIFYYMIHKLTK